MPPPLIYSSPLARFLLYLPLCGRCCGSLVIAIYLSRVKWFRVLVYGARWGWFSNFWALVWAILVRICVFPWRFYVLVSGLSCMLGHPVGFPEMIPFGLLSLWIWFAVVVVFWFVGLLHVLAVHRLYECCFRFPLCCFRWSTYTLLVVSIVLLYIWCLPLVIRLSFFYILWCPMMSICGVSVFRALAVGWWVLLWGVVLLLCRFPFLLEWNPRLRRKLSSRGGVVSIWVCALKSLVGLLPRSMLFIGRLPPCAFLIGRGGAWTCCCVLKFRV